MTRKNITLSMDKLVDILINLESIDNNAFKKLTFDLLKV